MKRHKPDLPDAAGLRVRAAQAEAAATEAERLASTARAEAASLLADDNAQAALAARNRAQQHAAEAEQQRDLAAELRRRADTAEAAALLRSYTEARAAAERAAGEAERSIRAAINTMAAVIGDAQQQQRHAAEICARATDAWHKLPRGNEAPPPASAPDVWLTAPGSGGLTLFSTLPTYRPMEGM